MIFQFIAPDIFGSGANKYKYNGKELQDELGLNLYDYGARNYDPALGRWMNMDALATKYYDKSPYNYVTNDPVNMLDPDGNFVVSVAFSKKHPNITKYLKENIKSDIMNSKLIMAALSKNTNGNLSAEVLDKITTFGSGPRIASSSNPGGGVLGVKANGAYDYYGSGNIELLDTRLEVLERTLADKNASSDDKLNSLLGVFMLIIHETTHYGDYLDGVKDYSDEMGEKTEWDIWWLNDKKNEYVNKCDKFNAQTQEEIREEKKDNNVLPTLPDYPGSAGGADEKKNRPSNLKK